MNEFVTKMSQTCLGSWHVRPTPARYEGRSDLTKTWTGPISKEVYGKGLKDLCNETEENLTRLSLNMQKMDPCIEYGIKHWHPNSRPKSAHAQIDERPKTPGKWESVEVMFTDNKFLDSLSSNIEEQTDSYVDPPARTSFCYLCSTLEEHKRHMLHNRPKKRAKSARPRVEYIAPAPRQKPKPEEEEVLIKERLYKVEVFTSDKTNAGTDADAFIAIKGSQGVLPRTQLKKNRGCAKLCFVRASKEVFHIKGPFLGNLQILTIEHEGKKKSQGWHLDRIDVTDVKAMKTWVFHCGEWLSIYEKPYYSNVLDLQAHEKETPPTEYTIEVHTGKQKMAGTDSNIYITLMGQHGSSKKIHLVDPSSDKKLFERNSVDKFKIGIPGVGELRQIRIEHDGKGFAAGWYLQKVIILDSERPKDTFHFIYGGWIARDEGDGRLWRDIKAKKHLSKEIHSGVDTRYEVTVKTGDKRFAGTDANVFIQLAGVKGMTKQLKLDDAKNNFERNMVDHFELRAVNVGAMKHIVIGHDNFGPGAGWYLENVTVRRYIPKDEALERLKKIKKRLKHEKKLKKNKRQDSDEETDEESDGETEGKSQKKKSKDKNKYGRKNSLSGKRNGKKSLESSSESSDGDSDEESRKGRRKEQKDKRKEKDKYSEKGRSFESDRKGRKDLFSVSSSSESSSDEESDSKTYKRKSSSASFNKGRPRSALRRDRMRDESSDTESASPNRRPGSALRRDSKERERDPLKRDRESSGERKRRQSLRDDKSEVRSRSGRRISTSASSLKQQIKGKDKLEFDDDDNLEELKVPLYEECFFECGQWFAADEGDGLFVRELTVSKKTTFFKEKQMQ